MAASDDLLARMVANTCKRQGSNNTTLSAMMCRDEEKNHRADYWGTTSCNMYHASQESGAEFMLSNYNLLTAASHSRNDSSFVLCREQLSSPAVQR